jgi:hypothetical protein
MAENFWAVVWQVIARPHKAVAMMKRSMLRLLSCVCAKSCDESE